MYAQVSLVTSAMGTSRTCLLSACIADTTTTTDRIGIDMKPKTALAIVVGLLILAEVLFIVPAWGSRRLDPVMSRAENVAVRRFEDHVKGVTCYYADPAGSQGGSGIWCFRTTVTVE